MDVYNNFIVLITICHLFGTTNQSEIEPGGFLCHDVLQETRRLCRVCSILSIPSVEECDLGVNAKGGLKLLLLLWFTPTHAHIYMCNKSRAEEDIDIKSEGGSGLLYIHIFFLFACRQILLPRQRRRLITSHCVQDELSPPEKS